MANAQPYQPSHARPPSLLDHVRQACPMRHFSRRTERGYVGRVRRFFLSRHKQYPLEMGCGQAASRFGE
jgi:hypothetical protein